MSYYDDQYDAWMENDCKGNVENYDPFDPGSWPGRGRPKSSTLDVICESGAFKELLKAADGKGLKVLDCGNGHFQIRAGRRLVNYYPTSKRKIAYANDTGRKKHNASVQDAIAMALEKIETIQ